MGQRASDKVRTIAAHWCRTINLSLSSSISLVCPTLCFQGPHFVLFFSSPLSASLFIIASRILLQTWFPAAGVSDQMQAMLD